VSVGTNPWIIEVSETANRIYVANYGSYSVSVIDGESNEVIATIGMGLFRTPGGIAVNEETNRVYIANTFHLGPVDIGTGRLLIVDGNTNEVLSTLATPSNGHAWRPSCGMNRYQRRHSKNWRPSRNCPPRGEGAFAYGA